MKANQYNWGFAARGFLYGVFTGIVVIVIAYLGMVWAGLSFPPFRLFDFLTRILPGAVITFVIDMLIKIIGGLHLGATSDIAKAAEQSIALLEFTFLGGIFGGLVGYLRSRIEIKRLPVWGFRLGLGVALGLSLVEIYLGGISGKLFGTVLWLFFLMGAWGWALGHLNQWASQAHPEPVQPGTTRREALILIGSALGALITGGLGLWFGLSRNGKSTTNPAVANTLPTPVPDAALQGRFSVVEGTRPEITSNA